MKFSWPDSRCIICLREEPLTEEHVIPQAIGGILSVRFLCKSCNSTLGSTVEARVKTDPSIRCAIEAIRPLAPDIAARLGDGQEYIGETETGKLSGALKRGNFRVRAKKEVDGSLVLPTPDGRRYLSEHLRKLGWSDDAIRASLSRFDAAPDDVMVPITDGLSTINRSIGKLNPRLNGPFLSNAAILKVGFEFLACILGRGIYASNPALEELRRVLRQPDFNPAHVSVEHLHSERYAATHWLAFEGNRPHSTLQVRLFGWLVYRIHLCGVMIKAPRVCYAHHLDKGEEGWGFPDGRDGFAGSIGED